MQLASLFRGCKGEGDLSISYHAAIGDDDNGKYFTENIEAAGVEAK